jgi:hypothetical protein
VSFYVNERPCMPINVLFPELFDKFIMPSDRRYGRNLASTSQCMFDMINDRKKINQNASKKANPQIDLNDIEFENDILDMLLSE